MDRRTLIASGTALALAVSFPPLPLCAARRRGKPVVLSTDCGADIDDQWALVHLALSPELGLLAVIGSHASSIGLSAEDAAANAKAVLDRIPADVRLARPAIVAGSGSPLADAATPRASAGSAALLRLSRGFNRSRRLTVLMIGAATDLASALLLDPTLADRIEVIAMAFQDWPAGGDVFNVKNDPAAWQTVLASDVPLTIGSSALTLQTLRLSGQEVDRLMRPRGCVGVYLAALYREWLDRQAALAASVVGPGAWVVWDEVVVACCLGLARGERLPRPLLNPDLSFEHRGTDRSLIWLGQLDGAALWRDLAVKLDRAHCSMKGSRA